MGWSQQLVYYNAGLNNRFLFLNVKLKQPKEGYNLNLQKIITYTESPRPQVRLVYLINEKRKKFDHYIGVWNYAQNNTN